MLVAVYVSVVLASIMRSMSGRNESVGVEARLTLQRFSSTRSPACVYVSKSLPPGPLCPASLLPKSFVFLNEPLPKPAKSRNGRERAGGRV